jgi:pyruvate dehydrogenase (quinone)
MGFALPAAIAVAERTADGGQVLCIGGDGGICITLAELATVRRLGVAVVAIVFNNGKLAAVKFEQEVMGWPEFGAELCNPDFAAYARSCGLHGVRVAAPRSLENDLGAALDGGSPVLLDVVCDPHELPAPPHIHPRQGAGYMIALAREAGGRFATRMKPRPRARPPK